MVLSFPSPHGPEDSAPQYQNLFLNEKRHRFVALKYCKNDKLIDCVYYFVD